VALNAAAALAAAASVENPASSSEPLIDRLQNYLPRATAALESGNTWKVFEKWVTVVAQVKNSLEVGNS